MLAILLGLLVFVSAFCSELVQVANTRRIARGASPHVIARLSVLEWFIGALGWIVVVRTQELGYLVPEVLGLYYGSLLGARRG